MIDYSSRMPMNYHWRIDPFNLLTPAFTVVQCVNTHLVPYTLDFNLQCVIDLLNPLFPSPTPSCPSQISCSLVSSMRRTLWKSVVDSRWHGQARLVNWLYESGDARPKPQSLYRWMWNTTCPLCSVAVSFCFCEGPVGFDTTNIKWLYDEDWRAGKYVPDFAMNVQYL